MDGSVTQVLVTPPEIYQSQIFLLRDWMICTSYESASFAYKWTIHDCKQKAKKKRETEIKLCWKEIFAAPKNRHCGIHKIYCNLVCHTSLKWETKYWSMILILTYYIRVWHESGVIFLFKTLLELHTGECLWHPLKFFNLFPDLC